MRPKSNIPRTPNLGIGVRGAAEREQNRKDEINQRDHDAGLHKKDHPSDCIWCNDHLAKDQAEIAAERQAAHRRLGGRALR